MSSSDMAKMRRRKSFNRLGIIYFRLKLFVNVCNCLKMVGSVMNRGMNRFQLKFTNYDISPV